MAVFPYMDEVMQVIDEAGWVEVERGVDYISYVHPPRDEYVLTFAGWNDGRTFLTAQEVAVDRAVYFRVDLESEEYPAEAVGNELAVFAYHYL